MPKTPPRKRSAQREISGLISSAWTASGLWRRLISVNASTELAQFMKAGVVLSPDEEPATKLRVAFGEEYRADVARRLTARVLGTLNSELRTLAQRRLKLEILVGPTESANALAHTDPDPDLIVLDSCGLRVPGTNPVRFHCIEPSPGLLVVTASLPLTISGQRDNNGLRGSISLVTTVDMNAMGNADRLRALAEVVQAACAAAEQSRLDLR